MQIPGLRTPARTRGRRSATAMPMTIGTNTAEIRSARRWIGALAPWALRTSAMMRESTVSCPTRVARICTDPYRLSVAPTTSSPSAFATGAGSPVSIDSSTVVVSLDARPRPPGSARRGEPATRRPRARRRWAPRLRLSRESGARFPDGGPSAGERRRTSAAWPGPRAGCRGGPARRSSRRPRSRPGASRREPRPSADATVMNRLNPKAAPVPTAISVFMSAPAVAKGGPGPGVEVPAAPEDDGKREPKLEPAHGVAAGDGRRSSSRRRARPRPRTCARARRLSRSRSSVLGLEGGFRASRPACGSSAP